ncbi:hypothetical protein AB0I72_19955 [Nocardiopsis sp. NPDC049922]|uniref:hypothetical protein n=1 Tax=Nocardiopsis sp. NPDC049922 TaxID=3155157 RepID=UPI0033EDDFFA
MTPDELATALADALRDNLSLAIEETTGADDMYVTDVATYERAGVLTADPGVVVTFSDGSEYQITAHLSRNPR